MAHDPPSVSAPPWRMAGECVLAWVRGVPGELRSLLPDGVRSLPGPAALVGVSYASSPIGPYCELTVALPARLGLRPGLCVVFQLVSVPDARLAYRSSWGLPASVGSLVWESGEGGSRSLRCASLGLTVRGEPRGPSFPAAVPVRSVQRRADGPVVVPRRFLALVRLARTDVTWTGESSGHGDGVDALLGSLVGSHAGAVLSGVRILARPARHPAGLWSSLRAPLTVPEPAMAVPSVGGGATTVASRTGRLAQLVRAQPSHG